MRTVIQIKELIDKYYSMPKSQQRVRVGKIISREKENLVKKQNYVDILYIFRSLSEYEKDRLLLSLLKKNPDSSLFVLAFADLDMHSYKEAYKIETSAYDNDEEVLRKDIELTFDSILCKFISEHDLKEDLEYVHELADGASWLEAYKRTVNKLSQLWPLQESEFFFGSFFYKKTPNKSELDNENYLLKKSKSPGLSQASLTNS